MKTVAQVAAAGALLAALAWSEAPHGERTVLGLRSNVVSIVATRPDAKEHYGFGFIVGERAGYVYVLTANHVVRDPDPEGTSTAVSVRFHNDRGNSYPAELLQFSDAKYDLGLLRLRAPSGLLWDPAPFAADTPARGTDVWFVGRNREWYVPSSPGRVNSVGSDRRLQLDGLIVQPGSSGAPVIGEGGILGLLVMDESAGTSHGVSAAVLKDTLADWQVPFGVRSKSSITPLPSPTARPNGGSKAPLVLLGVGAVGAGAAVALKSGGDPSPAPSAAPSATPAVLPLVDLRVNGQKAGNVSCGSGLVVTISIQNSSPQTVNVSSFELTFTPVTAACRAHSAPVDGTAINVRSVAPGSSALLRQVDLAGDLCSPPNGGIGCRWRSVVTVVTSVGRLSDTIEFTTQP